MPRVIKEKPKFEAVDVEQVAIERLQSDYSRARTMEERVRAIDAFTKVTKIVFRDDFGFLRLIDGKECRSVAAMAKAIQPFAGDVNCDSCKAWMEKDEKRFDREARTDIVPPLIAIARLYRKLRDKDQLTRARTLADMFSKGELVFIHPGDVLVLWTGVPCKTATDIKRAIKTVLNISVDSVLCHMCLSCLLASKSKIRAFTRPTYVRPWGV